MNQEQHRVDYMDRIDFRLLKAEHDMALKALVYMLTDDGHRIAGIRFPHWDLENWVEPMDQRFIEIYSLVGPEPPPAQLKLAYEHYLEAALRLVAYNRWLNSNGSVKRTTSEFVRSMRDRLFGPQLELLAMRIRSLDPMVSMRAWSELLNG